MTKLTKVAVLLSLLQTGTTASATACTDTEECLQDGSSLNLLQTSFKPSSSGVPSNFFDVEDVSSSSRSALPLFDVGSDAVPTPQLREGDKRTLVLTELDKPAKTVPVSLLDTHAGDSSEDTAASKLSHTSHQEITLYDHEGHVGLEAREAAVEVATAPARPEPPALAQQDAITLYDHQGHVMIESPREVAIEPPVASAPLKPDITLTQQAANTDEEESSSDDEAADEPQKFFEAEAEAGGIDASELESKLLKPRLPTSTSE